jgi:hypothetical protein
MYAQSTNEPWQPLKGICQKHICSRIALPTITKTFKFKGDT